MSMSDVAEWWDRYGDLTKLNKINEIIAQIRDLRFQTRDTIGTTEYLGSNTGGRKDSNWIYKSGMALSTWVTVCRIPLMAHGVMFMATKESASASYNLKNMVFVTTTIGYGIQQLGVGAETKPWNAGTTTFRIIDSGGYYLFQAQHVKYYGGSTSFLVSGFARYEN